MADFRSREHTTDLTGELMAIVQALHKADMEDLFRASIAIINDGVMV